MVTRKLACALDPTAIVPKLMLAGDTDNCGGVSPMPVTGLVLLPAPLRNTTALLKLPALTGLNRTCKLVEPKPAREKFAVETMANAPAESEALTLVIEAPPELVTTKLACRFDPIMTPPKSRFGGRTANWPGVRPVPVT